ALPDEDAPTRAQLRKWRAIIDNMAPGFKPSHVGDGGVRQLTEFRNEKAVQTHPKTQKQPCLLKRRLDVPESMTTTLKIRVSYHPHADWQLRVLADDEVLADQIVGSETVNGEWLNLDIDLTRFAGSTINLTLENRANDWADEYGFWNSVKIVSEES
ncbi:MAG: hypothetical protein GWQ05_09355, partial [Verrucomicrobiaceae bacterium]|nr:hypothetical protein [Verrucomicrobiaceae bacterium]